MTNPNCKSPPPDFSELSSEKRDLAEKLSNVGIWAGRIAEVLSRFSTERIRANFKLYRQQVSEQAIRRPGAWLYAAITQGFAIPPSSGREGNGSKSGPPSSEGVPEPGTKISETRKKELIREGRATEADFDKFKDFDDPDRKQHFYGLGKRPAGGSW